MLICHECQHRRFIFVRSGHPCSFSTRPTPMNLETPSVDFWYRVYSGVSAILDYEVINFRPYDCSDELKKGNCRIVELFLTVDTSKKMQNGVNIDVSVDRGVDILKNDVKAILSQIINSDFTPRHSTLPPGRDIWTDLLGRSKSLVNGQWIPEIRSYSAANRRKTKTGKRTSDIYRSSGGNTGDLIWIEKRHFLYFSLRQGLWI